MSHLLDFFNHLRLKLNNFLNNLKKKEDVFYINGPDLLPPPLSKEEEGEIIKRLIGGYAHFH